MQIKQESKVWAIKAANIMQYGQQIVYLIAGIVFLLIGIALLVNSIFRFYSEFQQDNYHAFFLLINDLMLLLIIMESMESIVYYLRYQAIPLKPFLHMGLIAAVRKILSAGAKVVIIEDVDHSAFNRYLMDLGVNSLVILSISISLAILARKRILSPRTGKRISPGVG